MVKGGHICDVIGFNSEGLRPLFQEEPSQDHHTAL